MFATPTLLVPTDFAFVEVVYVIGLMTLILSGGLAVLFATTDAVLRWQRRSLAR